MEEWQKSFFVVIETVVSEVEQFFVEVGEELTEVVESLTKFSEGLAEEIQLALIDEFDNYFNDVIEPIIDIFIEAEPEVEEVDLSFVSYVEPSATQQPACQGCRNYHGHVYGGNLLVCGMHPLGVESNSCPDWESDSGDDVNLP
ncbi:hypothetical protein BCD67_08085 [Oscillatoriales cyanobacterium USR001]|nr:hypothetical protein BCD67_08085 [Oscillatoriales cyanobacterium USR001]